MPAFQLTALVDACVLCSPIKRNLLLAFAESGLFQIRWSKELLRETERAIEIIADKRQRADAAEHAQRALELMSRAFPEANASGYEVLGEAIGQLPDDGDRHVIAAAIKARADVLVTENLKDFPRRTLARFDMEPVSSDDFMVDMIQRAPTTALAAIDRTRQRFQRPDKTPQVFLKDMTRAGLGRTVDYLNAQSTFGPDEATTPASEG